MTHESRAVDYLQHVLIACNRALVIVRGVDKERIVQDFQVHDVVSVQLPLRTKLPSAFERNPLLLLKNMTCTHSWS